MAKFFIKKGTTSKLIHIFIQDSSSTTGAGLTGLTSGSTGLVCYRARQDDGNAGGTQLVLSAGTRGTWSSGGFVEKDSTNMPGVYELGLDNAGLATGVNDVLYMLKGATNMAPLALEIQLVDFDPQSSSNLGLSALPTANPGAASGIFIAGTNAATTITTAGGSALTLSSTGANGNGLAISGNGSGAGLSVTGGGTGAGAKFIGGGTSGDGIDITTTSGDGLSILPTAGNGIVATANGTSKHGAVITGGTAGTSDGLKAVAGTGGVDIRGNITGNVTGNLSGSVGSVTARVTANTDQIVGVAVSTTTAQLGVNVVQYNAQTAQTDANNLPKVDVEAENGSTGAAQNVAKANNAIGRGTVGAASTTTSITTSAFAPGGAGIVSGQFIGRIIIFDGNTATAALQGQASNITASTSGATPTFTVTMLTTAPSSGDTFGVY